MAQLRGAIDAVNKELGPVITVAPFFETAPIGAADQPFINTAIVVHSDIPPDDALDILLGIERTLGRVRQVRWGNRTVDLDILLWQARDDQGRWQARARSTPTLTIPHPEMLRRAFVMVPAAAIAGDWCLPGSEVSLAVRCEHSAFYLAPLPAAVTAASCFEASCE